jgi:DNA-binding transcriptional LysR family regulator
VIECALSIGSLPVSVITSSRSLRKFDKVAARHARIIATRPTEMHDITDGEVFVRTVHCGSLSAAARTMNLTPAAVSYRLTKLESRLGTRLLHRTTRRLVLTEDGSEYFLHAQHLIGEHEKVEAAISRRDETPQGTLKLTMPSSFGRQHIAPLMPKFLKRYPLLRLNLNLSDQILDIMDEGVDLSIRICELKDSDFIAQKLAKDHRVVCASPEYLECHGTPKKPSDLIDHNCLMLMQQPYWSFNGPDGLERIKVTGNYECDNGEVIREAALSGLGLALKATWDIAGLIKTGRLKTVLDDYPIASDTSIWAVYPSRKNVPAKVTAFIGFLKEHFDSQPHWDSLL